MPSTDAPPGKLKLKQRPSGPIEAPPVLVDTGDLPRDRHGVAERQVPETPVPQREGRTKGRDVPGRWTVVHVLDRLEEAFEVLARMPISTRPRGYANSMPAYTYSRADLNAQVETGELERMLRQQNRVRIGASAGEVSRMEESLRWAGIYLKDAPEVARAVQLSALWAATGRDVGKRCSALKLSRRSFHRRSLHGLQLITMGLIRDRVPVM